MYDGSDFTVGDQLTDSLAGLYIAYHELKSYGVNESATWQLCQAAALHFTLINHVHSLPYITQEYAHEKLLQIQYLSYEDNVFQIITNPSIQNTWTKGANSSTNDHSNNADISDVSLKISSNLNLQSEPIEMPQAQNSSSPFMQANLEQPDGEHLKTVPLVNNQIT